MGVDADSGDADNVSPGKLCFAIDEPVLWRVPGPTVAIGGWCLDEAGDPGAPLKVRAKLGDQKFEAQATSRPDVGAVFPQLKGAVESGFAIEVVLATGRATVVLEALRDRRWHEFFKSEIVVDRAAAVPGARRYAAWVARFDTPAPAHLAELAGRLGALRCRPWFSLLVIGDAGDPVAADSLAAQVWRGFGVVAEGGMAGAPPAGEEAWIVALGSGDRLPPHAFARLAAEIAAHPEARWVYSDEDVWEPDGLRRDPWFKPGWDPELHTEIDFAGRLAAVRADVWSAAGAVRPTDWEGWWAVARTVTARLREDEILHIPHVLYHRAQPVSVASPSLVAPPPRGVAVGIVIPTRDRADLLERCVRAVLSSADYPRLECVLVDDGTTEPEALAALDELARDPRVRIERTGGGPFNFSALVNAGVALTSGEVVVLLNNDVEPITSAWLHRLVEAALRPGVGCVGARLDFPDGRIQHVGIATGVHGVAGMPYRGSSGGTRDPAGRTWATHRVAAVTAACLAVRRETWDAVGGMDAAGLPVSFSDVDFCLRVSARGLRNLVVPAVRLIHHESATRGPPERDDGAAAAFRLMRERWSARLAGDRNYNPNLSVDTEECTPAFPPRVPPGWSPGVSATAETAALDAQLAIRKQEAAVQFRADLGAFLATNDVLEFTVHDTPAVSVLVVLHNRADLAMRCLRALAGETAPAIELVIVDNASTDETPRLLERVRGCVVVRNTENLHFLNATNQAAAKARGRLLLLLNSDAEVAPGAIARAAATLDRDASIGAVGAKLVWPDGRLQEAGSIVWGDGRTQGVGRGDDPAIPEHNFRRPVDYVSGAFLLTPRALFLETGGFDERFSPAYYEDADYCLRLWERGLRVLYEPEAAVLHHEFSSSSPGSAATLQERNRRQFAERHTTWLAGRPRLPALEIAKWRTAAPVGLRVLVLEDRIPLPALGAGYPRTLELLRSLVALGCTATVGAMRVAPGALGKIYAAIPREVEVVDVTEGLASFLADRLGTFGTLIVCRPQNFQAIVELRERTPALLGGVRLVYDAEAVFARRTVTRARLDGTPLSDAGAAELVSRELGGVSSADVVFSVSPAEAEVFKKHGARRVEVLGHACDVVAVEQIPPMAARSDLLFVGSFHADATPNADALGWFVREILPRLPGSMTLRVVGDAAAPAVQSLAGPRVNLVGRVEDLQAEFNRARLFVAPGRYGAGIPLKVVEAAAAGLPVVITPLLAGQLGWTDGVEALVAGDAGDFAAAVLRLHDDGMCWQRLQSGALEAVRREFSRERFEAVLRRVLEID